MKPMGEVWLPRLSMAALLVLTTGTPAVAQTPSMPQISPVPPSGRLPLASASRRGTEYVDLERLGYVEEEYYLLGLAPAITASGEHLFDAPYVTRFLIRKPKDPGRFNGTVVMEPFSWMGERGAGWILTRNYLMRKGYAFAGYTLSINRPANDPKTLDWDPEPRNLNLDFMRRYDYKRYAPLGSYYDSDRFRRGSGPDQYPPQAQGIAAQLALLLKSNLENGPTQGLDVKRIYVNTWAINGQLWLDYLDQGRHQQWRMPDGKPLIDAYMTGHVVYGDLGGEVLRVPRKIPMDAPFVTVYSQTEVVHDASQEIALPSDTDQPKLRYYEVAGMPHLRLVDQGTDGTEPHPADGDKRNDPQCQSLYDEPVETVVSAILDAMDRWVREGVPMPKAERVGREGKSVARDPQTGNLLGGVRPPWIKVPSATYLTDHETDCGSAYDTKVPYSAQRLKALYGSYANYASRFEAAKQQAIKEGYLLTEDAVFVKPVALPADFTGPLRSEP
ncbi:alpha/beta hydrolase domain-containing protein [Pseudomonas sp. H1_A05]